MIKIQQQIFITGTPGSGKSSVAKELMQIYGFGFLVPPDDLREWVVSDGAHSLPTWTYEITWQFGLAYQGFVKV